jgi:hypothetical protein
MSNSRNTRRQRGRPLSHGQRRLVERGRRGRGIAMAPDVLAASARFAPETFRRTLEEINPEDRGLALAA